MAAADIGVTLASVGCMIGNSARPGLGNAACDNGGNDGGGLGT